LATFTAAVIPFLLDPLIQATDPIKAYEYLASGLPVVASRMPELERFGDLIGFYDTPAEFLAQLDEAIAHESADKLERRREFVTAETWEARGARLAELAENLFVIKN
jgi:glycosyltransferase involved in cell wall biosynthesis